MNSKTEEKMARSITVSLVEMEEGFPDGPHRRRRRRRSCTSLLRRLFSRNPSELSPWPTLVRRILYTFIAITGLATITAIVYHALLVELIGRLSPPKLPQTGLDKIVLSWNELAPGPFWLPDFSRGITPKPIHSHNDYQRPVPLFEALSLGTTGVEADCHLVNGELFIGHSNSSLRPNRTLKSLYLDPLLVILKTQNAVEKVMSTPDIAGVWDIDPSRTLVLMTDLKSEGSSTLKAVQEQLAPFRERRWLTYWNGTGLKLGPITHVASETTHFAAVLNSTFSNSTYRDVFFDAPLHALSDIYNTSNSYYASTSLTHLFGGKSKIPYSGLSKKQMIVIKQQIDRAASLGLVSRYWDIPSWPVSRRMAVWKQLEELGVGMSNVDEIEEAARWNWRWCDILGLQLC
ncbi:hypothetical protein DL98DRAFT_572859 [Cadophora sp. DSE1049]|nr:hypothetical protein DL98DRAFT_572859 [Cadophora sp. DSE1049]